MSNFTKEELYRLYDILLPHFTTLAEEANAHGIHLNVDISPEGRIEFTSRSNVTSICGCPLGIGGIPSKLNVPSR